MALLSSMWLIRGCGTDLDKILKCIAIREERRGSQKAYAEASQ